MVHLNFYIIYLWSSFSTNILHFYITEHNNAEEHLDVFYPQPRYKIKSSNVKTDNLDNPIDLANKRKYIRELERHLEKQNEFLGKQTDFQKEIVVLNEKLKALEVEKLEQSKQVVDLQSIIDRNRQELNSIRSELEQHKARALKTLQEKEKLIAELKSNAPTAMDEATIMELNQLKSVQLTSVFYKSIINMRQSFYKHIILNHRQERDSVREENQQMCQQLKMLREELMNADLNLEKIRQKSAETNLQNQEILANERRRRLETEEDMRLHSEVNYIFLFGFLHKLHL